MLRFKMGRRRRPNRVVEPSQTAASARVEPTGSELGGPARAAGQALLHERDSGGATQVARAEWLEQSCDASARPWC